MITVPDTVDIEFAPQRLKGRLGVPAEARGLRLAGPKELVVVEGAGHLFAEPGALDEVKRLAIRWFRYHVADEGQA